VLHALAEHKLRQEADRARAGGEWQEAGFVFTNEKGSPVDRHNLANRHFKKLLAEAGLPQIRLCDLRHTAATLSLSAGIPVKVVSEMLGHASVAMTLDVHSHVLPHMQEEAVQRMASLLDGENGTEWPEPVVGAPTPKRHTTRTQRKISKEPVVM
jgi:integrase